MTVKHRDEDEGSSTLSDAFWTWLKIGCLSFGGPAGQIAMMHKVLVEERRWIDEKSYLSALNFCMLLPGPEAMQLATYVGWRMHGIAGGLVAGLLFVLPGALFMLALALAYATFGSIPVIQALFIGIKAAVLAIVVEALLRVAKRALKERMDWLVATAAFVSIFSFGVPFPVIIIAAALFGFFQSRSGVAGEATTLVPLSTTLRTVAIWLTIWVLPLVAIAAVFGQDHVLSQLAWFFSKLAVVTFGGAYAVLAYMAQEVVQSYRWLQPGEMLDALGLAETTPGPLILVNEFAATIAAYRFGGGSSVPMGILGAVVALWATFAPCFLWIFAGAPYVEWLNRQPGLKAALSAVTAAVVGVILNLTVWFALHAIFGSVAVVAWGPFALHGPQWTSLNGLALSLSAVAFLLLFGFRFGIVGTMTVCGALALAYQSTIGGGF
jgi:chromate transporter